MWHAAQSPLRPTHEEIDGVTETELKGMIPHVAFYAGWTAR